MTLDANVVLRYLLWDVEDQAQGVKAAVDEGSCCLYMPILVEVVYVLSGVYGFTRQQIDDALELFIDEVAVYEEDVMKTSLRMYAMTKLDFIDCWLVARNLLANEKVLTFDKGIQKFIK